jgi:DNA-binding transcriptional LysR family regulator
MRSRLDSRSLELFLAVAETLSFRQAAESLHMTQPPLSRAIRELEERVGARLFERSTQSVTLTPAGHSLLPYARDVARVLKAAEAKLQGHARPDSLRLGLTSAVDLPWMKLLPARVQRGRASAKVSVSSDTSPRLVKRLLAGRLDAAIIALPTRTHTLEVLELDRQPLLVALASSHPLARRKLLRLADLVQEPLFWFERARQPAFYDHCQAVFARHGYAPRRLKEPADHHVLLGDVATGQGLALVPSSFAGLRRQGVAYRRLAEGDELAVAVGLATAPDRAAVRTLLLEALRGIVR